MKKAMIMTVLAMAIIFCSASAQAGGGNSGYVSYSPYYYKTGDAIVLDVYGYQYGLRKAIIFVNGKLTAISTATRTIGSTIETGGRIDAMIPIQDPGTYKIEVISIVGMRIVFFTDTIIIPAVDVYASAEAEGEDVEITYNVIANFSYSKSAIDFNADEEMEVAVFGMKKTGIVSLVSRDEALVTVSFTAEEYARLLNDGEPVLTEFSPSLQWSASFSSQINYYPLEN